MKNFLIGVAKVAVGFVIASVLLALLFWGGSVFMESRQDARNAPLAVAKKWPETTALGGKVNVTVTTKYRDSALHYRFHVKGYPPELDAALRSIDRLGRTETFTVNFLDADNFELFEIVIPLSETTRGLDEQGVVQGIYATGSQFVSAENYREAESIQMEWSL